MRIAAGSSFMLSRATHIALVELFHAVRGWAAISATLGWSSRHRRRWLDSSLRKPAGRLVFAGQMPATQKGAPSGVRKISAASRRGA